MTTHFSSLDPFKAGTSPLHHLDTRIKVPLVLAFILTTSLTPVGAWPVYILLLALVLAAAQLSDLGLKYILTRSLLASPFILAGLPLLFTVPGVPLAEFSLFGLPLTLSAAGLVRFASVLLKSWIAVLSAILLAGTTSVPDLLGALRALHLPKLLVAVIGLMWRYLFVMADEVLHLLRARTARSGLSPDPAYKSGGTVLWRGKVAGGMMGNLLLRSFDRSDRIYAAMLSRGYDGEVRGLPQPALTPMDYFLLAAGLAVLGLLLALGALL